MRDTRVFRNHTITSCFGTSPKPTKARLQSEHMLTRRRFTAAGGSLLAGLGAARATSGIVEIDMWSDEQGEQVGFDPIGIMLQPGQTVRWRCRANYHTTTAYHPANER